jgi:hypothetical protein
MHDNLSTPRGLTASFNKAGLAIKSGGSDPTFLTANTINFSINGKLYSKTAAASTAFTSGHTSLAAYQQCLFAVWLNASGTISTTQGPIVSANDVANGLAAVELPAVEDDKALIGLIEVETGNTTFIPGTTNLDAANVTVTYVDCGTMPQSPFTS